jgi:hypothetical protein
MLCELSSTETYKSRDWRKMKKYKHHANRFFLKYGLNGPIFKILLVVQIPFQKWKFLEKDRFKFLDELYALILECQC